MAGIKSLFVTGLTSALDGSTTTAVPASARDNLGDIRYENGKVYKYISYEEGDAVTDGVAGYMAYYKDAFDETTSRSEQIYDVCSDRNSTLDDTVLAIAAGMLMAALSEDEFGWIQVKGPATLALALTAGADGGVLTAKGAGVDGALDVIDPGTSPFGAICGVIINATSKLVILDCPY